MEAAKLTSCIKASSKPLQLKIAHHTKHQKSDTPSNSNHGRSAMTTTNADNTIDRITDN